ncbi:MAG: ATP-binding cassette domain-containing protein [Actinobacteria bacterium]|nr:ATP-binding cassette domain-containing protein [Actinomycetota bacterium]
MSGKAMIESVNLTKKFGNFTAVDGVNFTVEQGEVFGFLGPNGAGKSTTIRMLTTLLMPTSGTASVAGYDIVKEPDRVRQNIGLVAEKVILYNRLTAMENLLFFGQLYGLDEKTIRERARKWLSLLHMLEWADTLVMKFSTGMKQRVNIARALLTEPNVLFLDEPTLGLDPQTRNLIRNFITDLKQHGVTVVLTTHDMLDAELLCDRVAVIDHGRIVAIDTVENLKKLIPHKENPNLEDVYLYLTGEEIRDRAFEKARPEGIIHG